jgi:bifunctional enzyme CysN/CysC
MTATSQALSRTALPIVIAGHVDHGKSTLIGRLLQETGSLPEGKVAAVREMCRRRGMPFEWSFVTDALQAERDQGITIDTSQARFRWRDRPYILVDAPGHKEFLKNMVTGAAAAEAAVLVVDVKEGLSEQTRRHAYVLQLLGIRNIAVAVNKMDAVDYNQAAFNAVRAAIEAYFAELGMSAAAIVPVSARQGDGIVGPALYAGWYEGPSLIEVLDRFPDPVLPSEGPLRLPVQDIYKFDDRRIVVGRIESGRLRIGDQLVFLPGARRARIKSIESWNTTPILSAAAGQPVGITLDEDIFVERGQVASHADAPPATATRLALRAFSFSAVPLRTGESFTLRLATAEYQVVIESIDGIVQIDALGRQAADYVSRHDIADLIVTSQEPITLDDDAAALRRGVLVRFAEIAAAFVIEKPLPKSDLLPANDRNLTPARSAIAAAEREQAFGHAGGVIWFTGLSGAGKSTLATALERNLFELGYHATLLDGDAMRQGLNADLGFSPAERTENVRRIGEVARLLAESGQIALVACISPIRADRERIKAALGESFLEIYVKAGIETCRARDPKGLYGRALRGEIVGLTGISAPYEEPATPTLEIDTDQLAPPEAIRRLVALTESRLGRVRVTQAAS